jgi:hypothetical protein
MESESEQSYSQKARGISDKFVLLIKQVKEIKSFDAYT